jgi:hypothetical protein
MYCSIYLNQKTRRPHMKKLFVLFKLIPVLKNTFKDKELTAEERRLIIVDAFDEVRVFWRNSNKKNSSQEFNEENFVKACKKIKRDGLTLDDIRFKINNFIELIKFTNADSAYMAELK